MNMNKIILGLSIATTSFAMAETLDRPGGIRFGENDHLILRPYVSLSYTYDTKPDNARSSRSGSQWVIAPKLNATYLKGNWDITASAYYNYHAFNHYSSSMNQYSYGESLSLQWANALPGEKGWFFQMSENYRQISADDDLANSDGRGNWRDRKEFQLNGALQRRINQYLHASFIGGYYLLDYDNDPDKYGALYGWRRSNLGGQIGFTASKWTDILLSVTYQGYKQKNNINRNGFEYDQSRAASDSSNGLSLMGGIGTYATDRISYRVLGGWSRFDYGSGLDVSNGFVYELSANWLYSDSLAFSLLGSSYYQPSERYYSSSIKVYTFGAGVSKGLIRNKLRATLDGSFRKEVSQYAYNYTSDNGKDIFSIRAGLTYDINRFLDVFGRVEYQKSEETGKNRWSGYYDYNRIRWTLGLSLRY